jgi:hypothetical protein
MHTTLDDTIDNEITANVLAVSTPPGHELVNPFVLFRQQNSGGGFFKGDIIRLDHNTGAVMRKRGNDVTLVEPEQRRYVVNPNEMIDRWVKYINGELVQQLIYRTAVGEMAPTNREELSIDMDERNWPLVRNKRKDPWSREVYLPMKGTDGEIVAFKATGKSAIAEIGDLVGMYGSANRGGKVPVVEIKSRSFDSRHDNKIHVPVFRLVSWELWDGQPIAEARPVAALPPSTPNPLPKPAATQMQDTAPDGDLDDEIPF